MSTDLIVKLNIGGTRFQTTKSTLTKFDGFFKSMMENEFPAERDDYGYFFVNQDAKHFDKILNFMRDDDVALPESVAECIELRKQADFYGLIGLMSMCDKRTDMHIPMINDDEELTQVINNPEKATVIIRARFTQWGQVFHSTTSRDFLEKFKAQYNVYFMILADEGLSWSYQIIGGGRPNPYGRMTPVDNLSSFLTQLEANLANFADNSFEMVDGVWETSM